MASVLECAMLVCFGFSWPVNMVKSIRSKTAKGKSLCFEFLIIAGYLCGIACKTVNGSASWVLALYLINVMFVATDVCVTLRNRRIDHTAEKESYFSTEETKTNSALINYRKIAESALERLEANENNIVAANSELLCGNEIENCRITAENALNKFNF